MPHVPHKLHNVLMDLRMAGYRVGQVESTSGRSFEITKNGNFVAVVKGDKPGEKKNNLAHRLDLAFSSDELFAEYVRSA